MNPKNLCAGLLACVTLACGPQPPGETASDTSTSDPSSGTSTTTPTTTAPTGTTGEPVDPCTLEPDPGGCDAAFFRYYFDPATQRCRDFFWGGCDGQVPFETAEACQSACEPCDAFSGDKPPAPVHEASTITLRNTSAQPIYLRPWAPTADPVGFRAQIFGLDRLYPEEEPPLNTAPNACDFSCGQFDNDQCATGCSDGGSPPPPILIHPGGAFTREWNGQHFGTAALPDRCLPAACEPGLSCGRWLDAWLDAYVVSATVATMWECVDPDCTCEANADGWCELPPDLGLGQPVDPQDLTSTLSFPGDAAELVFE